MAIGDTLQRVFGKAFSGLYDDAVLYKAVGHAKNANKSLVPQFVPHNVKVQEDSFDASYLSGAGIPLNTSRFLILQDGLTVTVDADDELEHKGTRYRIQQPVNRDPANAYYDVAARPAPSTS